MIAIVKKILSSLWQSFPVIQPVEFSDGLLAFRCDRSLPFESLTVASLTASGSIVANIEVCSYDAGHQLYRAQVANCVETLQKLQLPGRGTVRLAQSVRVSSRQIPKYFALTEDLSVSGLRLATPSMMSVGGTLRMDVDLDDPMTPTLNLDGEVCWTAMKADGTYHSGVRFVGLDRVQHRILERYIDNRLATQRTVHGDS